MPALDQWEQRLKPYFNRSLRIIGEIPLTRIDVEDMLAGVRACIQRNGMGKATTLLTRQYPHLYLTFLAGFAALNTEKSYWIALADRLGVTQHQLFGNFWHYAFLNEVKQRRMPYFDGEDTVNPFVNTIRFHGGIPAYSLPDFFERLLMPTIRRPGLNEVPTRQAMANVLNTAYFVDSPVLNFLENSGQLGEDFFDACRRMARHYMQTHGDLLPAAELGLPEYVVEAFGEWMEREKGDTQPDRLRKPALAINPYDRLDCAWLLLPEQEIDLRYAGGELEWRIDWPGLSQPERLRVRLLRRRQDTLIREVFFPIEQPVAQVAVGLFYREGTREEMLRRWTLPLAPSGDRTPLLAFRAQDGRQVRASSSLPAEVLYLVYPSDTEVALEGPGRRVEEYSAMYGGWQGWQVYAWDLTEAWSVSLFRRKQQVGYSIPVAGRMPEPQLVGGALSPYSQGETPLYVEYLPGIEFPLRYDAEALADELKKWFIEVDSVWDTDPDIHRHVRLDAFETEVNLEENNTASLNLSCLLGSSPIGTYEIRLFGPGSVTKHFRLRFWPKLTVIGLPKRILSPEQNTQPVRFTLRLLNGSSGCESQAGAGDVQVRQSMVGWDVAAGPDVSEVNLNLTWRTQAGATVRVPVSIPIPRVRWALAMSDNSGDLQWSTAPLQRSALSVLQSETAALHIRACGLGTLVNQARLELVDLDTEERQLQGAALLKTVFSPDWMRVPLGQFNGTLHHGCEQGRFDLVIGPRQDEPEQRIPLLLVPRRMEIRDVALSQISDLCWRITWTEEHPLKNRRLMLVPAWQPWQEPWEIKVPDDARGAYVLDNISLPLTRYHLYFYVAPSWEPAHSAPPPGLTPHLIDLCSPEKRLAAVERQTQNSDEENLRKLVEEVCIYHDMGNSFARDEILGNCPVPFVRTRNLRLMLGFLEWLKKNDNETIYRKFLWKNFYRPELVKDFLKLCRQSDPLLRQYFSYVGKEVDVSGQSALLIAEHSDDSEVIFACLKQLLRHEDEILILLIIEMIEKARLSHRDAVELLSEKPVWTTRSLAAQLSNPVVDRLLAAFLPKIRSENNDFVDQFPKLIARAMPYETDPKIRLQYISLLMLEENELAVDIALQGQAEGSISVQDVEALLSLAPRFALQVLMRQPESPAYQQWLRFLEARFPQLVGVIHPGTKIKTPIGVGVVDYIEDKSGLELPQSLISSRSIRISLLIGDGADRVRVWLDLVKDKLIFFEAFRAWKCPYCEFIHPDRRAVDRHYHKFHPRAARVYRDVPADMDIDRSKLELL